MTKYKDPRDGRVVWQFRQSHPEATQHEVQAEINRVTLIRQARKTPTERRAIRAHRERERRARLKGEKMALILPTARPVVQIVVNLPVLKKKKVRPAKPKVERVVLLPTPVQRVPVLVSPPDKKAYTAFVRVTHLPGFLQRTPCSRLLQLL